MTDQNHTQSHPETTPFEPEEDDDVRITPPPSDVSSTFVPPDKAVRARFRRLNLQTGGWEDCKVIVDGTATSIVDAKRASPNLPLVEQVSAPHRITWYAANDRRVGYSNTWNPFANLDTPGGASNTPRKWPAGPNPANAVAGPVGLFSSQDVLALMRGMFMGLHEAAAPIIAQVQMISEQTLARERAFHSAQLAAEEQRHREAIERDRQFTERMREVYEVPRDAKIAALEQELKEQRAQAEQDRLDAEEDAEEKQQANAYDFAGKVVESAPDIIRTVAEEARKFKRGELDGDGVKVQDVPTSDD